MRIRMRIRMRMGTRVRMGGRGAYACPRTGLALSLPLSFFSPPLSPALFHCLSLSQILSLFFPLLLSLSVTHSLL